MNAPRCRLGITFSQGERSSGRSTAAAAVEAQDGMREKSASVVRAAGGVE